MLRVRLVLSTELVGISSPCDFTWSGLPAVDRLARHRALGVRVLFINVGYRA